MGEQFGSNGIGLEPWVGTRNCTARAMVLVWAALGSPGTGSRGDTWEWRIQVGDRSKAALLTVGIMGMLLAAMPTAYAAVPDVNKSFYVPQSGTTTTPH
jgi:hypothetical protein